MKLSRIAAVSIVAGLGCSYASMAYSEVTLKSVTALPRKHPFNKPFENFIALVNKRGKGEIQIRYVGGPDVTPVQEQMKAVSSGVLDIFYGPLSYYLGEIPEAQVFNGSNKSAKDLRDSGAIAALQPAFNKRLKAHFLGYYGSGYTFFIYLKKKPKIGANGLPDLTGLKLRGAPTYRKFFSKLGASTVLVHVGEMYTALERGLIDGIGWIGPGVTRFGWDKFVKYRITPPFWQGDISSVINQAKWKGLSDKARQILSDAAMETEISGHEYFVKLQATEFAKQKKNGMTDVKLTGEGAKTYLEYAHGIGVWQALSENISEKEAAKLKAKFYSPSGK